MFRISAYIERQTGGYQYNLDLGVGWDASDVLRSRHAREALKRAIHTEGHVPRRGKSSWNITYHIWFLKRFIWWSWLWLEPEVRRPSLSKTAQSRTDDVAIQWLSKVTKWSCEPTPLGGPENGSRPSLILCSSTDTSFASNKSSQPFCSLYSLMAQSAVSLHCCS